MTRPLDGVLLLDKPVGLSSNAALQIAKRLYSARKAGHTGTLDPLASGLLPLCFGEATKFAHMLLDADKRYLATLQLGVRTDSGDAAGEVISRRPATADATGIAAALARFQGEIQQIPPMHSALKRHGRPLYELARQGLSVAREPRRVRIEHIALLRCEGAEVDIDVQCSKGTYIRALADDLGEALGCGAHLKALRRSASGAFDLSAARTLAELEAMTQGERDACLLPADAPLAALPSVVLDAADALRLAQGRTLDDCRLAQEAPLWRVYDAAGRFLGVARREGAHGLAAQRLISSAEDTQSTESAHAGQ